MSRLRGYAASISKYTGVTDAAELAEIEELMRDVHRTLNGLSAKRFAAEARSAKAAFDFMRTPAGQAERRRLEAQYGIVL